MLPVTCLQKPMSSRSNPLSPRGRAVEFMILPRSPRFHDCRSFSLDLSGQTPMCFAIGQRGSHFDKDDFQRLQRARK